MKRTISAALAAALILSLTSCSQLLSDAAKATEGPAPVAPPDGTGPGENEPPENLGVDEYGFTLWPEGNYLADPGFDTDEYLPDFDADQNFVQYAADDLVNLCVTEDSIYSLPHPNTDSAILTYTDRGSNITLPVCGRPECTHDSENCNAYLGRGICGLRVYDGRLWWATQGTVNTMDLDGSNHAQAVALESEMRTLTLGNSVIHRGYLYRGGCIPRVKSGEVEIEFKVLAQPLNGGKMITVMDRFRATVGKSAVTSYNIICCVVPAGNDLVILLSWEDDMGTEDTEDDASFRELYLWSSKTRKAQCLYAEQNGELAPDPMISFPHLVPGEGVFFAVRKETRSDLAPTWSAGGVERPGWMADYTIARYSFETGAVEELFSFSVPNGERYVTLTRDHIIAIGPRWAEENTVLVYDYNGELIFQGPPMGEFFKDGDDLMKGEDGRYIYIVVGAVRKNLRLLAIPLDGGEVVEIEWTNLG